MTANTCWETIEKIQTGSSHTGNTQWYRMQAQETSYKIRSRLLPDIRKPFFSIRIIREWNMLPRKTVSSLSLDILKTKLAKVPSPPTLILEPIYSKKQVRQDDCLRPPPS